MKQAIGTELDDLLSDDNSIQQNALRKINQWLETRSAEERVAWAMEYLPGRHSLASSFGIQAALMLHLVTQKAADIPVILIDTGYLFPETYLFVDQLSQRLGLNLKVYRSELSPAWQESRLGRLWEQGLDGLKYYNRINKVEPMAAALSELDIGTWFAGLRREQSSSRSALPVLRLQEGRFKFHPIIDWTNRDVYRYLQKHDLPYHPLWDQGYTSVGDTHTSSPLTAGMLEEDTRFFGLKRECGLHD